MKLTLMGPVSLILLTRARARERIEQRRDCREEQQAPVREAAA